MQCHFYPLCTFNFFYHWNRKTPMLMKEMLVWKKFRNASCYDYDQVTYSLRISSQSLERATSMRNRNCFINWKTYNTGKILRYEYSFEMFYHQSLKWTRRIIISLYNIVNLQLMMIAQDLHTTKLMFPQCTARPLYLLNTWWKWTNTTTWFLWQKAVL